MKPNKLYSNKPVKNNKKKKNSKKARTFGKSCHA